MAVSQRYLATQQMAGRGSGPSGLADVLEVLLDKGLVVDVFLRVALLGIELLTVDARIVIASVDTYLRFAEAVNRLDLRDVQDTKQLGDIFAGSEEQAGEKMTEGAIEGVGHEARKKLPGRKS
jgi:hypothetical protein